jgi:hypothetical protein
MREPDEALVQDLEQRFFYHPPTSEGVEEHHERVNKTTYLLARHLAGGIPECREVSLALTKLEEARMWFNAAVARYQVNAPAPEDG